LHHLIEGFGVAVDGFSEEVAVSLEVFVGKFRQTRDHGA